LSVVNNRRGAEIGFFASSSHALRIFFSALRHTSRQGSAS
jgi:hypothetical protein